MTPDERAELVRENAARSRGFVDEPESSDKEHGRRIGKVAGAFIEQRDRCAALERENERLRHKLLAYEQAHTEDIKTVQAASQAHEDWHGERDQISEQLRRFAGANAALAGQVRVLREAVTSLTPTYRKRGECWCPAYHNRERHGHCRLCVEVRAALAATGPGKVAATATNKETI